jgi:hypothetical protein
MDKTLWDDGNFCRIEMLKYRSPTGLMTAIWPFVEDAKTRHRRRNQRQF